MKAHTLLQQLLDYFNLDSDIDRYEKIHTTIENDVVFKGTNLWILVFAIIIASVGLNMNSSAVIIGAMLISPLMGPINGMGYSIATYNLDLFNRALRNFSFAVLTGLLSSTAYFFISPISTAHSELLARTSPTIYDVIIALFGGMAGIVAISSKHKGNVIAGVAIATALMPPLCTAGYGLATGQWNYFLGAFYLFTINTVFIALSSVIFSQILKFPIITVLEAHRKKRIHQSISLISVIVLLPSIYFGNELVKKERFSDNSGRFIQNISVYEGNYLIRSDYNFGKKFIYLDYAGVPLSEQQKNEIRSKASGFNLTDVTIEFGKGLLLGEFSKTGNEMQKLSAEIFRLQHLLNQKEIEVDSIREKLSAGKFLLQEIRTLFPQVESCLSTPVIEYDADVISPVSTDIVLLTVGKPGLSKVEKIKIRHWLQARLKKDSLRVVYEFRL